MCHQILGSVIEYNPKASSRVGQKLLLEESSLRSQAEPVTAGSFYGPSSQELGQVEAEMYLRQDLIHWPSPCLLP